MTRKFVFLASVEDDPEICIEAKNSIDALLEAVSEYYGDDRSEMLWDGDGPPSDFYKDAFWVLEGNTLKRIKITAPKIDYKFEVLL